MFGWLLAGGNQPSQGTFLENCRTEAQPDQRAEQNDKNPYSSLVPIERDKSVSDNQPSANEDEKTKRDRRIAEYTCQLSIYTAQLASFTHWLFIATIGLALVGLWQGINIERSVDIANRTADEARDAITATQAQAVAAKATADASQEANRINREVLIASNCPWIALDIKIVKDAPVLLPTSILMLRSVSKRRISADLLLPA